MVSAGHGAEKMGSESGADNTKSPVAAKGGATPGASAVDVSKGGEETGARGRGELHHPGRAGQRRVSVEDHRGGEEEGIISVVQQFILVNFTAV
mgnify:CR=1 FL=1